MEIFEQRRIDQPQAKTGIIDYQVIHADQYDFWISCICESLRLWHGAKKWVLEQEM